MRMGLATWLNDGRHYDAAHGFLRRDIDFWRHQASEHGDPILELACGTGRIAIPVADDGHDVTGIDVSESMLEQARRKSSGSPNPVRWVNADIRSFQLDRKFALIIVPFNGMCLLQTDSALAACLERVRQHLSPDGRFVVDVSAPKLERLASVATADPWSMEQEYQSPDGDGTVRATHTITAYDSVAQVTERTIRYHFPDGSTAEDRLLMRVYFPRELRLLLERAGFRIIEEFGSYDRAPPTSGAQRYLLVCELQGKT